MTAIGTGPGAQPGLAARPGLGAGLGPGGAPYAFDADTRLTPVGDHVYAVDIDRRWNALGRRTNGGFLLALCVEAMGRDLPEHPDPLVLSAFYLRAGGAGPAEIRSELVRPGRRVATAEAHLVQGGKEAVRVVGNFTDLTAATGPTDIRGARPDLPPPDECLDPTEGPPRGIGQQIEYRMASRPGWSRGEPSGDPTIEMWMHWRDGRPTDIRSLPIFVDALPPAVLELGVRASSTVELTVHVRARPAPGWIAGRVSTRNLIDGYHEEDVDLWDETGRLVAQARQLSLVL